MEISEAARRIAETLNATRGSTALAGGQFVFRSDGSGGQWYSADSYGFGPGMLVFPVRSGVDRRLRAGDVQRMLDDIAARDPEEDDRIQRATDSYEFAPDVAP